MESNVWFLILGAVATWVSGLIKDYFSWKREDTKWSREQQIEKEKRDREEKKLAEDRLRTEKESIRETYQKSIQILSALAAEEPIEGDESPFAYQPKIQGEKRQALIEEAHKFLSLLSLRHGKNEAFLEMLTRFSSHPDANVEEMRYETIQIANSDKEIITHVPITENKKEKTVKQTGSVTISYFLDDNFRKETFAKSGENLSWHIKFDCKISDLTETQRKRFTDMYFSQGEGMPEEYLLDLPKFISNQIRYKGEHWKAKLNPNTTDQKDILAAWEKDYDAEMEKIEQQKSKIGTAPPNK